MLLYLCLTGFIICEFSFSKNKEKALGVCFLCFAVLACLRDISVGIDTRQFCNAFTRINKIENWTSANSFRYEHGFYYLCKFLGLFSGSYRILIVAVSSFNQLSVWRFIKKYSPDYMVSTLLYLFTNSFFRDMNVMRQTIAVSILLWGFDYLIRKKYPAYFLLVFLASTFHVVALSALLLVVFDFLPKKKIIYAAETAAVIITFVFYKQFFKLLTLIGGHSGYSDGKFSASNYFGALLETALIVCVLSLLLICSGDILKKIRADRELSLYSDIGIIYVWFCFLVMRQNIFNRVSGFFAVYLINFIPFLLKIVKERNESNYRICKALVLLIFFLSFVCIGILRPEWFGGIPYELFFLQ